MKAYITRPQTMASVPDHVIRIHVDKVAETITFEMGLASQQWPNNSRFEGETFLNKGKEYRLLADAVLSFSELKANRAWSDRQAWHLTYRWDQRDWSRPIPLYTVTLPTRMSAPEFSLTTYRNNFSVGLAVPFADSQFDECVITANISPDVDRGDCEIYGLEEADIIRTSYSASSYVRELIVMPDVSISGASECPANENVEFELQIVDADGAPLEKDAEIYLEAVNGYLPKSRVRTVNGTATAKFMALGLQPGDKARIKAGFKFFLGAADLEVNIT